MHFSPHRALAQQDRDRAALTPDPCPMQGGLGALRCPNTPFHPPWGMNLSGLKKTITETGQTRVMATWLPQYFHAACRLFCLHMWSDWKLLKKSLLIMLIDSQKKLSGDKSHKMRNTASKQG